MSQNNYQLPSSSDAGQSTYFYPTTSAEVPSAQLSSSGLYPGPQAGYGQGAPNPNPTGNYYGASPDVHNTFSGGHPGPHGYYQTGYDSSQGGSQAGYNTQYGGPQTGHYQQPVAYQQGYGDAYNANYPDTSLGPGAVPNVSNTFPAGQTGLPQQHGITQPGYSSQHAPTPRTSQNVRSVAHVNGPANQGHFGSFRVLLPQSDTDFNDPANQGHFGTFRVQVPESVADVNEPANQGHFGSFSAGLPQAPVVEPPPEVPGNHVRENWTVRQNWVYDHGSMVGSTINKITYTMEQFQQDYYQAYGRRVVPIEPLETEYLRLRNELHGLPF